MAFLCLTAEHHKHMRLSECTQWTLRNAFVCSYAVLHEVPCTFVESASLFRLTSARCLPNCPFGAALAPSTKTEREHSHPQNELPLVKHALFLMSEPVPRTGLLDQMGRPKVSRTISDHVQPSACAPFASTRNQFKVNLNVVKAN